MLRGDPPIYVKVRVFQTGAEAERKFRHLELCTENRVGKHVAKWRYLRGKWLRAKIPQIGAWQTQGRAITILAAGLTP